MATPTVSASLNKTTFASGEIMTLTINYSDTDTKAVSVTITVSDSAGNQSEPVTVNAVVDALTIAISDDSGREWTLASNNGSVAVYTAVA